MLARGRSGRGCTDVGGGLGAPDVLLAGRQRQHVAAAPSAVDGLAGEAAGSWRRCACRVAKNPRCGPPNAGGYRTPAARRRRRRSRSSRRAPAVERGGLRDDVDGECAGRLGGGADLRQRLDDAGEVGDCTDDRADVRASGPRAAPRRRAGRRRRRPPRSPPSPSARRRCPGRAETPGGGCRRPRRAGAAAGSAAPSAPPRPPRWRRRTSRRWRPPSR